MTLMSRIAGALAKLPAPHTHDVSVERDLAVKMPDGAVLLADRWFPTAVASGPPPTVLLRSPYGRRQLGIVGRLFAERGYQVVIQSCRGTFGSTGDWVPMHNEHTDGHATLEWVASQPWFDGRLATFGPSYLGLTQWSVAEDAPPFVKAMSLQVTASNFRDAVVYPGGSFALDTGLAWLYQVEHQESGPRGALRAQVRSKRVVRAAAAVLPLNEADRAAVHHPVPFYQDWLSRETPGDTWWDGIHFGRRLENIPPASLVAGWYDIFLPSQIADYEALRDAGRTARLTVGPWTHASPRGSAEAIRDGLEWFDEHVAERPRKAAKLPVNLFVMGSKRWEQFSQWPPPAEPQRWYLGHGGTLATEPSPLDSPDRYRYDPADPTPGIGGPSLNFSNAGRKDQKPRESRSDVLTYTSGVFTSDLTVIGPVSVTLHLRSSLDHTDFFVRVCDVSPKGKSTNLCDGIIRLTTGSVQRDVDGIFHLDVSLWPTATTFLAGHRIRLQVSSGAHPLFARNTGSGEPLGSAATLHRADQEVWRDEAHPSYVTLPVVRGSAGIKGGAAGRATSLD
jgi:putative CocE/NonD family hydrolase